MFKKIYGHRAPPMSPVCCAACFKTFAICRQGICHYRHKPFSYLNYTESETIASYGRISSCHIELFLCYCHVTRILL